MKHCCIKDVRASFASIVLVLVMVSGCAADRGSSMAPNWTQTSTSESGEASISRFHQPMPIGAQPFAVPYYPPPERMDLGGELVPLQNEDVRERFDKEFTVVVYNHAQVYLWLKRMERYFPWIEERLKYHNLPDDLKYVVIVESDLLPNACSPKGAAGPWQFMPSTAAAYGMEQQGSCDMRYDFERSTDGAFRLLKDLHARYKSWSLAIATYNCGDKRILDEMRTQRVNDYYSLKLPMETERYVFRILAIKAVLGNPARYGYSLPPGQGYSPHNVEKVRVTLSSSISIQTAANAAGTTFREFKRLNPTFRTESIPAGSHEINVPRGSAAATFERSLTESRTAAPTISPASLHDSGRVDAPPKAVSKSSAPKPAVESKPAIASKKLATASPRVHTVQKGDTLASIAKKYGVGSQEIMKANKLKDQQLGPGQKLTIP